METTLKQAVGELNKTYFYTRDRINASDTYKALIKELKWKFPLALVRHFERLVMLTAVRHTEWSVDDVLKYVSFESDKHLKELENKRK